MVSEHASPLAAVGGVDAGGQNVHVLELSTALAAGGDEVIVALRRLPGVELLVAGGGAREALDRDPDAQRLQRAAAAAGVADRVRLLGAVARPDVPALLRSADAV